MRTTLTLDDDIYHMAKTLSEQTRTPMGEVVSRLVRRGLSRGLPKEDGLGLPVFIVSEGTPLFGPEDVARAEDEL